MPLPFDYYYYYFIRILIITVHYVVRGKAINSVGSEPNAVVQTLNRCLLSLFAYVVHTRSSTEKPNGGFYFRRCFSRRIQPFNNLFNGNFLHVCSLPVRTTAKNVCPYTFQQCARSFRQCDNNGGNPNEMRRNKRLVKFTLSFN